MTADPTARSGSTSQAAAAAVPPRLEVPERRLLRDGHPVELRAKVFDTLLVLVENHGHLVGKDQLLRLSGPIR
jgi:DNA-binding response OmpR family regulator